MPESMPEKTIGTQCVSKLILSHSVNVETCADPERFVRGGTNLTTVLFLVDERRENPNNSGPSSVQQQNAGGRIVATLKAGLVAL